MSACDKQAKAKAKAKDSGCAAARVVSGPFALLRADSQRRRSREQDAMRRFSGQFAAAISYVHTEYINSYYYCPYPGRIMTWGALTDKRELADAVASFNSVMSVSNSNQNYVGHHDHPLSSQNSWPVAPMWPRKWRFKMSNKEKKKRT